MQANYPYPPSWMRNWLFAAGLYNIVWGALAVLFPSLLFRLVGAEQPRYLELWQCVGMIVGVYGVGYYLAATNPAKHWVIVLVGMLGKVFGPIGFLWALYQGTFPLAFAWVILANDLIWWIPFALTLKWVLEHYQEQIAPITFERALDTRTSTGKTLGELSQEKDTLVLFLRHRGCTFCREAAADLSRVVSDIEDKGIQPVIVMMSRGESIQEFLSHYGLGSVASVSDPTQSIYKAFGLSLASWMQVMAPVVWFRGVYAGMIDMHGVGLLEGNGFQMPGLFLLKEGKIKKTYNFQSVADRPDYLNFVSEPA